RVSGAPLASLGVAVSCGVRPAASVELVGLTVIDATGTGLTVTVALPLFPSLEAVIVTGPPTVFAVTNPLPSTSATAGLSLAQLMVRPVSAFPLASFAVATSWAVWPRVMFAEGGVRVTDAIGTGITVTSAVPVFPSLVAAIITGPPTATADASPVPLTCAMVEVLVDHVTERPDSGL